MSLLASRGRRSNGTTLGLALIAAACLVLLGCGSLSAPPKDKFYRLPAMASPSDDASTGTTLVYVAPFTASGLHAERAVVYAHEDGTSLEQHGYHYWVDSPRIMLQRAVADRLAADLGAQVVTEPASSAAWVVRGHVRRFERTVEGGGHGAAVALDVALYEGPRADVPVLERSYARTVSAGDDDVPAGVAALGRATADIVEAVGRDLGPHVE